MNLIYNFLKQLGVRHVSEQYCLEQYLSEPMSGSLLGVKRLLARMGVPTQGVRFDDPASVQLEFPCIVHLDGRFAVATAKNWDRLKPQWDGIALVPLPFDADAVAEPDYRKHRWMKLFERCCLAALLVLPLLIAFVATPIVPSDGLSAAVLLLDAVGMALSFLLLQKSVTGHSALGDRLCSLLDRRGGCNSVLNSPAAKIMGFSWSEIGMGYFAAHLMTLLGYWPVVVPISLCAMLFAFWSIGYQWRRVHGWCLLCLLVQAVLWAQGILLIVWAVKYIGWSYWLDCVQSVRELSGCLYFAVVILVAHYAAGYLAERRRRQLQEWSVRSLLRRKEIFQALLAARPSVPYADSDINERMGSPDAPPDRTIVVITSPSDCIHCRELLAEEKALLEKMGGSVALCHINLDLMDPVRREEVTARLAIDATPRIIVNRHLLPTQYTLADLALLLSE